MITKRLVISRALFFLTIGLTHADDSTLKSLSEQYSKDIWLDLKGRQLRIAKWADPLYEAIELNHNIDNINFKVRR